MIFNYWKLQYKTVSIFYQKYFPVNQNFCQVGVRTRVEWIYKQARFYWLCPYTVVPFSVWEIYDIVAGPSFQKLWAIITVWTEKILLQPPQLSTGVKRPEQIAVKFNKAF